MKRGKGARRQYIPKQSCQSTLYPFFVIPNQEKLFTLLSDTVSSSYYYPTDREVCIASGQSVVTNDCVEPKPCSDHEEADTRV